MRHAHARIPASARLAIALVAAWASGCAVARTTPPPPPPPAPGVEALVVTATAYNSVAAQTDDSPRVTAHGVRLRPGMRVVAVSRDLEAHGLEAGRRITIDGLPGEWEVADRMSERHRRRIDVYMGDDVSGAREFGKRRVTIRWKR